MGQLFNRYLDGDCVSVWQELVDLRSDALQPPHLDDAMKIAEEMVRRIIHNAKIIGQYLIEAGYDFETPGPFVVPADETTANSVRQIEQEFGELPLFLKIWWRHVDHFNHLPTEAFRNSGQGCAIEGILTVQGILIESPGECLATSLQRAIDIREHIEKANAAGIDGEEEYYEDEPNLVLGPYTSGNDHVGYQLPLRAVDGISHRHPDDEEPESLVDWLRFYYLQRGGLGHQYFGAVSKPEGGTEMRYYNRPQDEVKSIVEAMELVSF